MTEHTLSKTIDRYLTVKEEKQLFKVVGSIKGNLAERDMAWMELLRYTAIRVGSLVGISVQDARHAIAIGRLELRSEFAKRGKGYSIPLTKKAKHALKELLRVRVAMGYALEPDAPLVMSQKGKGISIRSLQSRLRHWVDMAGLDDITPHWFRHTLAMRIMNQSTAVNKLGV
ncbi:MAG TPA: recombinase XerC, partial [Methylophaga sp.]|nr:recombinase XerC [Methylophaga sp.]